ncbi:MAG: EamA family transporter [Flavobacteriaceae bacterium CG_4_10_14_3_um_filter_33_47]|nr:MAG: EamA family transporter [Flavobacteriaceae bacterium CG17_big_fil_post_rev_8_21_14_2_50_33_15]PIY13437.1 MAG: EamA family transporter [Flavobacteriaceae bacterium CG_4_10_14_3_um_filter_33_47]PJB18724.1 MAG: EamA family transporter [Flavobacteriaceae bacterium CG_4_9_14_3_um_filter_33_16]
MGANLIYGANFMIAKGVMPNKIGPSALVVFRLVGAGLLFWIIKKFIKETIDKKDYLMIVLCAIFGAAVNMLLFFHGLSLTSPIDASIISTSIPVMVLIFSAFILKEKITNYKLLGIAIGGLGAFLLVWYGNKKEGTSSLLGNVLVFINTCSYALYLVLIKPLMMKYNPITIISWVFLLGLIFVLPFGINDVFNTNYEALTLQDYLSIGFVVIGTTFLTYLFNIYALQHVAPSIAGSYVYLQPAISFVLVVVSAYILTDDTYAQDINLVKVISCFLVISGVYLVSKKQKSIV